MTAYYNEIDPYAAQWLRNLIVAGHIAPGDVDTRSIADVRPDDLAGYVQCHFFAGIGGWSLAARLAGWPDDRPVWTGSCPCQPFSKADAPHGNARGVNDPRHLWPAWRDLIVERRPTVVFGEQVTDAIAKGWLDQVEADLEAAGYRCGAACLPARSVGALHRRPRLYFVADADRQRLEGKHWPRQPARHARRSGYETPRPRPIDATNWVSLPEVRRVVDGVPCRMDKLRAIGNAIVPQLAAEVMAAYMDL